MPCRLSSPPTPAAHDTFDDRGFEIAIPGSY
jgi:hypothetical protein